ncbi:Vacuolar protein-sorting-associated protein 24 [Tieghemiomyces parasiticus]|uniref:Vacuolar protein-sorting-associated protein 24 n=1 Tax=Tieghemiomyces parasiticus TaxID=78921 RepID=A0A9W8DM52_9FUNG|nr:Vacuolar protein-sorting-associated protein 24 [Tieghemiomyces parasiticus]
MILKYFQKPKPEELVRKWRQTIQSQQRVLNRQIRNIELEEAKTRKTLKTLAKKKDLKSSKILARELVRSGKQRQRIHTSIAQLNSINMELQRQAAMLKVAGHLSKSTEVMHQVNNLVRVPQIAAAVQEMSQEMMKAGIISDMIEDTLDTMDDEGIEDEAEEEVNKVLYEITDGLLGQAGTVGPQLTPAESEVPPSKAAENQETEEEEADLDEMQARLAALRA